MQVEDIEGRALYDILGVEPGCSVGEVRTAYRRLARRHHPDKGGEPTVFAKVQHAYEVLSDSTRRQVYDTWAKELEFRYVQHRTSAALGGEDVLLDEFENLGLHCNPGTQLVVTCEVCRRPATKECWTCKMKICEFCTLKRHWKDGVPLHWPLINSDHMRESLAKRELESKKKEDARLTAQRDPNYRSERELKDIRAFKEAAYEILKMPDRRSRFDLRVGRFYMWAQTPSKVFLVCNVPTGYGDRDLVVECNGNHVLLQAEDSPPLIDRYLAGNIDTSCPIESMRAKDNTMCIVSFTKKEWNEHWKCLFVGDSDGCRSLVPAYDLYEGEDDVILQIEVPFWIDPDDVSVEIDELGIDVKVRNDASVKRTFWRNEEEASKNEKYRVVQVEECSWHLEDDIDARGEKCKLLTLNLVRPPLTEDEKKWKKGVRQDNRQASRQGSMHKKGFRFFAEDEDMYGLEDILQALCFLDCGKSYVAARPWDPYQESRWAQSLAELTEEAQKNLMQIQDKLSVAEDSKQ